MREEGTFPHDYIWTPKEGLFLRMVGSCAILTPENLGKRRITYVSWCFMCKSAGENIDHLLLHRKVANRLWWVILNLFRMQWVMPGTVKEALQDS